MFKNLDFYMKIISCSQIETHAFLKGLKLPSVSSFLDKKVII